MLIRLLPGLFTASALLLASSFASAAEHLVPPPGYYAAVGHGSGAYSCPEMPPPYTAALDFPSKYAGSGKARDQINEASEAEYKQLSKPITEYEKSLVRIVDKYVESGRADVLKCALSWYDAWAASGALQGSASTHTGRSVRKWALASISGAWLQLKFSSSQPLAGYSEPQQRIERWLGQIAEQVKSEWDAGEPPNKINNHFYWAAWAVMATSVVVDRRDLFDWSAGIYRTFASQVDGEGWLPNELARDTRALSYHNFAITPVAMMAAFGKANGLDLPGAGNGALARLATRTLQGIADPSIFESKTGVRQLSDGLDDPNSALAWLEPYCWAAGCSGAAAEKLSSLRPVKNTRLGGDMTRTFAR